MTCTCGCPTSSSCPAGPADCGNYRCLPGLGLCDPIATNWRPPVPQAACNQPAQVPHYDCGNYRCLPGLGLCDPLTSSWRPPVPEPVASVTTHHDCGNYRCLPGLGLCDPLTAPSRSCQGRPCPIHATGGGTASSGTCGCGCFGSSAGAAGGAGGGFGGGAGGHPGCSGGEPGGLNNGPLADRYGFGGALADLNEAPPPPVSQPRLDFRYCDVRLDGLAERTANALDTGLFYLEKDLTELQLQRMQSFHQAQGRNLFETSPTCDLLAYGAGSGSGPGPVPLCPNCRRTYVSQ